jgi:26S proteasome regulatory subunit N13
MDMSQLASLLGRGGGANAPSNDCLIEFKAGRMNVEGKQIIADKRRGTIKVVKDPQGIKQFQWTEYGSNNPFQNIMIFPGDAKFEKVKQSKDRVYLLEFHQSKHRHFYWMQEKDEEEDDERCKKVHNLINGIDEDGDKSMEVEPKVANSGPATTGGPNTRAPPASQPPNPGSGQNYEDMLAQFLNNDNMNQMMNQMQPQKSGPDLSSVITSESKNKIFEDEKICERLYEHCPDNQQDRNGLRENLHSPTLRHVFSSLHNAIENGQGHILLNQMGIDTNNPGEYEELVELFNNIAKGGSS